ncbi:MAG: hypothetical protein K6G33_13355 [Ruminococcus sp.]|uniref:hypothetical protein n=1 Tax=Ruminococcus sp. TaxID=41978 RepID=UPI0025D400BC|nr:hypothetical protein [Ruminococcus sp.]MCR5601717.1 hypothetical protein [Ruminococcus sp.]
MKKMINYIAAIGMMLSIMPCSGVYAAETTAVVSTVSLEENTVDVKDIAGEWKYQVSDGNHIVQEGAKDNGTVVVKEDGTYTYTDAEGKTTNGTVKTDLEEIGGTKHTTVLFSSGSEIEFMGYYNQNNTDALYIGNGSMARLIRVNGIYGLDAKDLAGVWNYQIPDGDHSVQELSKNNGKIVVKEDGSFTYTDVNGKITKGTVKIDFEEYAEGTTLPVISFSDGTSSVFSGYYHKDEPDMIYYSNSGIYRIVREKNNNENGVEADANVDGHADMSDVVFIMQALTNPDKYGINGTAERHLTEQGKINGDMNGDGLTIGDALNIQEMLLGLK